MKTGLDYVTSLRYSPGVSPRSFVWVGGGGRGGFIRHPNPPTPTFSFSSDFGHFVLKMAENAKYVPRKKILKYHNFWGRGTSPTDFSTAGHASLVPRFRHPWYSSHGLQQNHRRFIISVPIRVLLCIYAIMLLLLPMYFLSEPRWFHVIVFFISLLSLLSCRIWLLILSALFQSFYCLSISYSLVG